MNTRGFYSWDYDIRRNCFEVFGDIDECDDF